MIPEGTENIEIRMKKHQWLLPGLWNFINTNKKYFFDFRPRLNLLERFYCLQVISYSILECVECLDCVDCMGCDDCIDCVDCTDFVDCVD